MPSLISYFILGGFKQGLEHRTLVLFLLGGICFVGVIYIKIALSASTNSFPLVDYGVSGIGGWVFPVIVLSDIIILTTPLVCALGCLVWAAVGKQNLAKWFFAGMFLNITGFIVLYYELRRESSIQHTK
jgi:hypothetical protein